MLIVLKVKGMHMNYEATQHCQLLQKIQYQIHYTLLHDNTYYSVVFSYMSYNSPACFIFDTANNKFERLALSQ